MRHLSPIAVLCLIAGSAHAQYFEGRNSAMGGAGVASSRYIAAPLANPALLANFGENDSFGFILPAIGVGVADNEQLIDRIDAFQDELDAFQQALDNSTATLGQAVALDQRLQSLDQRRLTAAASANFVFAFPSETLSIALVGRTYADAQGFVTIAQADRAAIFAANNSADLNNIQSEGRGLSAAVTDIGLSLATSFELAAMRLSIGVTPKFQRVDTYNYAITVDNFDQNDFDDSSFRNDDTGFNADVGAALTLAEGLTVGAMVRNVVEEDYRTVTTNGLAFDYTVSTVATLGAAIDADFMTVAVDVDVTQTKRFGRQDESQYLRGGVEFDAFGWLQVRGGLRLDLEDATEDVFTAGLGFSPFDLFHLDVAGQVGDNDTYAAVVQTSFTF